jgi:hypothetical protein
METRSARCDRGTPPCTIYCCVDTTKGFRFLAVSAPESDVRVERYSVQRKIYFPKHNTVGLDATNRTKMQMCPSRLVFWIALYTGFHFALFPWS